MSFGSFRRRQVGSCHFRLDNSGKNRKIAVIN
jgi:hypothetical protein